MKPQDIINLTTFLEGELSGAKKVLKWIADEMAKEEKQLADAQAAKQNEEKP